MSARSWRAGGARRDFIAALLAEVDLCLAQSEADAERLDRPRRARGARRRQPQIRRDGAARRPAGAGGAGRADLGAPDLDRRLDPRRRRADRGRGAPARRADLPRRADPDRAAPPRARRGDPGANCRRWGSTCALRSRGERPERETAIYICDTMGELGLFYRLAGVVMVGKSFVGGGGQNPIEPAKLASAVLHGPHVANFADVYALLDEAGGAALARDADELAALLAALFADPARLRAMARAAARAVETPGRRGRPGDAGAGAVSAGRRAARARTIAPGFWARARPSLAARALQPLGALYGLATARRMARPGRARRGRRRLRRQFRPRRRRQDADRDRARAHAARRRRARRVSLARLWRAARAEPIEVDAAIHGARRRRRRAAAAGARRAVLRRRRPGRGGAPGDRGAARARWCSTTACRTRRSPRTSPSRSSTARRASATAWPFPPGRCARRRRAQLPFVSAEVVIGGAAEALGGARARWRRKADLARQAGGRRDRRRRGSSAARCSRSPASRGREKFFATLEALGARVAVTTPLRRPPRLSARARSKR